MLHSLHSERQLPHSKTFFSFRIFLVDNVATSEKPVLRCHIYVDIICCVILAHNDCKSSRRANTVYLLSLKIMVREFRSALNSLFVTSFIQLKGGVFFCLHPSLSLMKALSRSKRIERCRDPRVSSRGLSVGDGCPSEVVVTITLVHRQTSGNPIINCP